jgi:hypothetical protein
MITDGNLTIDVSAQLDGRIHIHMKHNHQMYDLHGLPPAAVRQLIRDLETALQLAARRPMP